jgi:thiosulfate sulfurtransferase
MAGISTEELLQRLAVDPRAFTLLDVRKAQALQGSGNQVLPGAQWLDPALWLDWKDSVPSDKPVVLYCAHGHEISQGLTTVLSVMGRDAVFLQGGFGAWVEAGQATQLLA